MATDRVDVEIRCPACAVELTLSVKAQHTGRGQSVLTVDTTPVREHITEHDTVDQHSTPGSTG